MHKFLLASTMLLSAPALAGPQPTDAPYHGAKTVAYAAGTADNVLGDGSDAHGGTPPADADQPADPSAAMDTSNMIVTGDYSVGFCDPLAVGATCGSAKFRTVILPTHVLNDDPERNFCQPGTAHTHLFWGNPYVAACSTYRTFRLRNVADCLSLGTGTNCTGYWTPAVLVQANKFGDGKQYAVKGDNLSVYYEEGFAAQHAKLVRPRRGFRYIAGANMDDPFDSKVLREIYLANAQSGTSGRYTYFKASNLPIGYGLGAHNQPFSCTSADGAVNHGDHESLVNADGTDPWGGTCTAGSVIRIGLAAPQCWDGTNLASPDGYSHVRQMIWDITKSEYACPQTFYRVPSLKVSAQFTTSGGWNDYKYWKLSSDAPMQAKIDTLPDCSTGYANAPCVPAGMSRTVLPGQSWHADWMNGWHDLTFAKLMHNCLGTDGGTPHECGTPGISATEALKTPEGIDFFPHPASDDPTQMFLVHTPSHTGMGDMISH